MLEPGDVLQSRYVIEGLIGAGGMGRVYRARQCMLGRLQLAVKEINLDSVPMDDRYEAVVEFMQEAETLAQLSHPNLVNVRDCFEEAGQLYLVMDLIEGEDLQAVLDRYLGGVPLDTVLEWALQLCTVLSYLHTCDPPIMFRDLKPANVMLDERGIIRLIDFGIAQRVVEFAADDHVPQGTDGYAPIEQLLDLGVQPDARSDIYALGATLFHLLTGQCPPSAGRRLVEENLDLPRDVAPDWLSEAILRMLALRWEDRFSSAMEVREYLQHHLERQRHPVPLEVLPPVPLVVEAWWLFDVRQRCPVELQSLQGRTLSFRVPYTRGVRLPSELVFEVPYHRQPAKVGLHLLKGHAQGDTVCCEAVLQSPPPALLRALADSLRPAIRFREAQRRRVDRVPVSLTVSVDNPPLHGHAIDLSMEGCRLWLPRPVELESIVAVTLAIDNGVLPDIQIQGEVRWCGVRADTGYETGLYWQAADPRVYDILSLFLDTERTEQPELALSR